MTLRILKSGKLFLPALAVVVLAWSSYARNAVWLNEITLWEDAARKSPHKGRAHHNLGRAYDTNSLPDKAFEQYLIATEVDPDLAKAHESLGISYVSLGDMNKARQQLEIALKLNPDLRDARMFLAFVTKQETRHAP